MIGVDIGLFTIRRRSCAEVRYFSKDFVVFLKESIF